MKLVFNEDESFGYNGLIKQSLEELKLPTTTADHFPDRKHKVLGPVIGCLSSHTYTVFPGFSSSKDGDYDGMLELFRIQTISRMIKMAHMLGGDAMIGMRFDFSDTGGCCHQCVYGVAVKFIEDTMQPPKADNLPDNHSDGTASRVSEWTSLSNTTAGPYQF